MTIGVYVARDASDAVLYVGSSGNIEKRLTWHRNARSPWLSSVASIETIPTETRFLGLALERRMIGELRPRFNVTSVNGAKSESKAIGPVVAIKTDVLARVIEEHANVANLAEAIGVGHQSMSSIWRGTRLPSSKVVARLMATTGLAFDDLFYIDNVGGVDAHDCLASRKARA